MNYESSIAPVGQLKTNRGLLKLFLLSIITLGLYPLFFYASIGNDVNVICSRYDGKKTMSYWLLAFLVGPATLGIGYIVWIHRLSNRIGGELYRRGLSYSFDAGTYWLWTLLGSLILVGPFVYLHKLCKAMNILAAHYNTYG